MSGKRHVPGYCHKLYPPGRLWAVSPVQETLFSISALPLPSEGPGWLFLRISFGLHLTPYHSWFVCLFLMEPRPSHILGKLDHGVTPWSPFGV